MPLEPANPEAAADSGVHRIEAVECCHGELPGRPGRACKLGGLHYNGAMRMRAMSLFGLLAGVLLLGSPPAASAAGYDSLLPLLVDLPGWEAEPADGADASFSGMRAVTAYRNYTSGERSFDANILIGMEASSTWAPDYREGLKVETPEGVTEVRRIGGFLVFSTFDKADSSGGILVLLQEASGQQAGAVFAVSFEGLSLSEALALARRFDWSKMKAEVARLK